MLRELELSMPGAWERQVLRWLSTDVIDVKPAVAELERQGMEVLGIEADVTDQESLKSLTDVVVEKWGKIDILINNAAIYGSMSKKPFWELDSREWETMLRVNVIGSFLAAKACVSGMKEQKWGRIINIASGAIANAPPKMMHYNTSKAAHYRTEPVHGSGTG